MKTRDARSGRFATLQKQSRPIGLKSSESPKRMSIELRYIKLKKGLQESYKARIFLRIDLYGSPS